MTTIGHMQKPWRGHRWVMHTMWVHAWLSLIPCNGVAASASGQVRVVRGCMSICAKGQDWKKK